jgi:hypothetical protein
LERKNSFLLNSCTSGRWIDGDKVRNPHKYYQIMFTLKEIACVEEKKRQCEHRKITSSNGLKNNW